MLEYLKTKGRKTYVVDADEIVRTLGNAKSLNVALLGAATVNCDIGITKEDIANAVVNTAKAVFLEQNLKALDMGADISIEL